MPADLNDYFNKRNGGGDKKGSSGGGNQIRPPSLPDFGNKTPLIYLLIAIVALFVLAKPYAIINSGEVGIKVTTGKFEPVPLYPGLHFYIPGVQKIITIDSKVRIINYKGQNDTSAFGQPNDGIMEKPAITVMDTRGLPVSIDLTVQYRLKPDTAPQTISNWGLSWEEKLINAIVREVSRNVVGSYKAEELPIKRNEIAIFIEEGIRTKVERFDNKPVELKSVQLREISLPLKIREQIEKVQVAKQEVQRVQQEVERAKKEAEKKAALAQGDADAKKIQALGEANKIKIEAEAQSKANYLISKSLTPAFLKLEQIKVQGKFNEALKVNRDSKIFLTPGGAVPNIWIDAKDKQRTVSVGQ
ncbi:MAG TPA: prohibitin family protein [Campylobacterales bacterium]|nr:prohibitin family protein [Campylobacterales bacterium]